MPRMGLATLVDFLPRLLLFSTVYKRDDGEATGTYVDLLVVTSPSSTPLNTSGLLLVEVKTSNLVIDEIHRLERERHCEQRSGAIPDHPYE